MPKDDKYDDEGTWIWMSMAAETRLVLSHVVGERSQKSADKLVKRTAQCLKALPLFVTDGLKFYKIALLKQYGKLQSFIQTGKRGRPRLPRLIPDELLKYAQIIKQRTGRVLTGVESIADLSMQSIEQNIMEQYEKPIRTKQSWKDKILYQRPSVNGAL